MVPSTLGAIALAAFVLAGRANALVELGSHDTPGRANDVALLGSAVLVADGSAGLRVVDLTNPAAPVAIGSLAPMPVGNATVVVRDGTRAYLGESGGGVSVVDVSNPAAPVRLGNVSGIGPPQDLASAGNHLFVSTTIFPGLYVLDVSNPAAPFVAATLAIGGGTDLKLTLHGTLLYTDAGIVDVANPLAPVLVSTAFFTGGLAIDGALAATREEEGVDLSDPLAPVLGPPGSTALDVALTGSLAWMARSASSFLGMSVTDVSDLRPLQPLINAVVPPWSDSSTFDLDGPIAVGSNSLFAVLGVMDFSNPTAPVVLGTLPSAPAFTDLDVVGNLVYATLRTGPSAGLFVLDISNPATPVQIGWAPLADALRVVVEGNRAYVQLALTSLTPTDAFHVFDVSNPSAPIPLGGYAGPDTTAHEMDVDGTRVYLAASVLTNGSLVIVDAATPSAITEIARVATLGTARGVAVAAGRAYVASDRLDIWNVQNPAFPMLVTSFDMPGRIFSRPRPSGSRLYVGSGDEILTLDIADPVAPRVIGAAPSTVGSRYLDVAGTLLFQAGAPAIEIYDASAPSGVGPQQRANAPAIGGEALALDTTRELAVLARGSAGIAIVDIAAELAAWECANGRDDDGDTLVDAAADSGCRDTGDASERPDCNDGLDDDGDAATDFPADANCASANEASENPECDDGIDGDGDGLADFGVDPGCSSRASNLENPKCQNGLDDDADGKIDFDGGAAANGGVPLAVADPHCTSATRNSEVPSSCGLGAELVLVAALARIVMARKGSGS